MRFATVRRLIAGCPAMELTIADVPLTAGTTSTKYTYEIAGALGSQSGSDSVDCGATVRLGWSQRARSQWLMVRGELGFDHYHFAIGSDRRMGLGTCRLGVVYRVDPLPVRF